MTDNERAFLEMISISEGTQGIGDRGYNVLVGSTKKRPVLFDYYDDHPRRRIYIPSLDIYSSAAGKYQLLERYFDYYRRLLKLSDFSPRSQDLIALQQIRERGALPDIDQGLFDAAVDKCKNIWASLPNAGYEQHENKIGDLRMAYVNAGGKLAA